MTQQRSSEQIVLSPSHPPGERQPDAAGSASAGHDAPRTQDPQTPDTGRGAADASTAHAPGDRSAAAGRGHDNAPLLEQGQADDFLRRWSEVQARFVDDPRAAVLDGDSLVAELVQALASRFSQHKSGLEEQWSRGAEPSTEELRLALQQYRSFFQRLLAT